MKRWNCATTTRDDMVARTLKHEEVYLRAYNTVREARASIARYIEFYNARRPHSSIQDRTPDETYFGSRPRCPDPRNHPQTPPNPT